ncbi:MAG: transcriptional regulator BetI [Aestuariivita sp.]|uniref:choline-binding transcriptional repressor BetI n=1 Tax=Aestuariivita sp. TaxID=1872407 RepID=UPI003BB11D1A
MPKLGMEPIRRSALVKAAIAEIGEAGSLDVTVSQIARRAGMSSALAHHYFGSKEQMLVATMRHILTLFGAEVRGALTMAQTPELRLEAIVRASFASQNFRPATAASWLHFYLQAQSSEETRRLLHLYHRRLRSNLMVAFRPLVSDPEPASETIGALIDGVYLRQVLRPEAMSNEDAIALVLATVQRLIREG